MRCVNRECGEEMEEDDAIFCYLCGAEQTVEAKSSAMNSTLMATTEAAPAPPIFQQQERQNQERQTPVSSNGNQRAKPIIPVARKVYDAVSLPVSEPVPPLPAIPETPERMRALVKDLYRIINEYHRVTTEITERRHSDLRNAKAELDNATSTLQRLSNEANARRAAAQAEIEGVRAQIKRMQDGLTSHLQMQRVTPDIPLLSFTSSASRGSLESLNEARQHVAAAERVFQDIVKIKKPGKIVWPDNDALGCAGLAAAIIIASMGGSAVKEPTIGIILFFSLFGAFVALLNVIPGNRIKSYSEIWRQAVEMAEESLESFQRIIEDEHHNAINDANARYAHQANQRYQLTVKEIEDRYESSLLAFKKTLMVKARQARERCSALSVATGLAGAPWNSSLWLDWKPATSPAFAGCIGKLHTGQISMVPLLTGIDLDFSVPALVAFANGGEGRCLLFKAQGEEKDKAIQDVQSVLLRLLATIPPGKVRFTFIDPVGLGQNVAAFMPLGDFDESLINGKVWTEPQHIEHQLVKLTEHMETVIQKYLRNEYATIEKYNNEAGEVAEPYRVLVVLDFPVNFSETSARRLVSIAQNGPRCGVYTFVVMDTAAEKRLPYGFSVADLERAANVIDAQSGRFKWEDEDFEKCSLYLEEPPAADLFNRIIEATGTIAKDAMSVQVPYSKLLEKAHLNRENSWTETTEKLIQVPLGPRGAKDVQYLTFGQGMAHHAIVIGRTGSGKSNLMHVIITTLALAYSPDEIQLYLIDFKQGVEFKPYADAALRHAKVIAIESEREFGLSVLEGLDQELHRRGELFRLNTVNNITEYRKSGTKLPRILLLVDEFQEFFVQDDNISRQASLILERLVRQGRSAGIHVMLGSQTLAGASNLPHSIISQMGVRIALQCSETDSRQIMGDENPVYRQLTRPGEAIYNAASGQVEGNKLFQVAMFTDEDRVQQLLDVTELTRLKGQQFAPPRIFEGNEPSRIESCQPLNQLLEAEHWPSKSKSVSAWLGEPIAIRPPTAARFRRQGSAHLLAVTRDEQEGVGMLVASIISLAAQLHPDRAQFLIANFTTADTNWNELPEELAERLPHQVRVLGRRELSVELKNLVELIKQRLENPQSASEPDIYLVIAGLHRARDLRLDEGGGKYSLGRYDEQKTPDPSELFASVLRDGAEVGVYVIAWCDAYTSVKRSIERKVLGEFGLRVAGAMSNEDSTNLIDDASASRLDKPHRAIFYDEERPGYLEKFRPYAIPEMSWLWQAAQKLRARISQAKSA